MPAGGREGIGPQHTAYGVCREQHAEEQHLGGQERPHAERRCVALLGVVVELLGGAGGGGVHGCVYA